MDGLVDACNKNRKKGINPGWLLAPDQLLQENSDFSSRKILKEYDDFKSVFDGWDFAYSSPDIPTRVANIEKHLL